MLVQTVKGACPARSCLATMGEVVPLPRGEHAVCACQALVGPNVSIAVMMGALPSHARMEACALKKPASHFSIASAQVDLWENGANKANLSIRLSPALGQIVKAKPMMVFVTRNVIHFLVVGMVVTAPWQ